MKVTEWWRMSIYSRQMTANNNNYSLNWMQSALHLAEQNRLAPPPNPAVGCVIVSSNGLLLGQGHTHRAGGPHAEIVALCDAQAKGNSVSGASVYLTLEPCSHQGRTGPCCEALIKAGVKTVFASCKDPNPLVAGQGFDRLRAAGIDVHVGLEAHRAMEINIGFFSRMVRKTPWVRMKVAASLDGKTALENGKSQWITGEPARADGHAWRARACAVLTGIGTVLDDDPSLDVRLVETPRQPHLVVVDSQLQTPLNARLFTAQRNIPRKIYIYSAIVNDTKKSALEALGATVVFMPMAGESPGGKAAKVDLALMMRDLASREINELHVEAGHRLNGSLVREGLVDEFLVYLAPKLIGQGRDMANFGPLAELGDALQLTFKSSQMLGDDLRLIARVAGRDNF